MIQFNPYFGTHCHIMGKVTHNLEPRIMVFTPRYRYITQQITSLYKAVHFFDQPVEWLETINDQPKKHHTAEGTKNLNILHNYQIARLRFLESDCTHLLTVEDDMIIPEQAIVSLMRCCSPVAYSLYCWRTTPHEWSSYRLTSSDYAESLIQLSPHEARTWAKEESVVEVDGLGLGCTLIQRDVVKTTAWRLGDDVQKAACDWLFALDCKALGFRQVVHFGVQCGHVMKTGDGSKTDVIWPDPDNATNWYRLDNLV